MNLIHLKYVLEIYKTKNFSKAAENLYMGQPNLSRAIKELEQTLGITLFNRTTKGLEVTEEGEEFVQYAKKILNDVEKIEKIYTYKQEKKERFSIIVPRASYISKAFTNFVSSLSNENALEFIYKETNSYKAINKVLQGEYRLGIVRYKPAYEKYFRELFLDKGLTSEVVYDFKYKVVMHKDNPLATKNTILFDELKNYIELSHPDPYVPTLPFSNVKKTVFSEDIKKRIFIYERASQFEMLSSIKNSFMWVSPIPKDILDRYNLVELECSDLSNEYKDVLIYRNGYKLTKNDTEFLTHLCIVKREVEENK